MKSARILICLLALAWWSAAAPAPSTRTQRSGKSLIGGRIHTDLTAWAAANGFTARWNSRAGELRLTNRWAKLLFKADTKRVAIDGSNVWLSYPLLRTGERLHISQADEDAVLHPLLNPPRLAKGDKMTTVAISAGHGGKDPGNLEGNRQEKVYTLALALELERQLRRAGLRVVQVRERDKFVALEERPAIARARGADVLLCLHFNASPGGDDAQGLETYCLTPAGASSTNDRGQHSGGPHPGNRYDRENINLAYLIHRSILGQLDLEDRGVRHSRFKEITLATMPAAYLEGGFMSSREDARKIYSEAGRVRYAGAIVDGVLAYKRLVERGQPE